MCCMCVCVCVSRETMKRMRMAREEKKLVSCYYFSWWDLIFLARMMRRSQWLAARVLGGWGGGMHCVAVIGVLWDWIFAVLWDSSHRPLFHVLYTGSVRCNASWNPEASYESSSHKATAIRFFDSHPISWRCSASYDSANILYSMFI